jgi:hypothetical protein
MVLDDERQALAALTFAVRAELACPRCGIRFRQGRRHLQFDCPTCEWEPASPPHDFWFALAAALGHASDRGASTPATHHAQLEDVDSVGVDFLVHPEAARCPWCGSVFADVELTEHLAQHRLRLICRACGGGVPVSAGSTWIVAGIPQLKFIMFTPMWIFASTGPEGACVACSACGRTAVVPRSAGSEPEPGECPQRCLGREHDDWDFLVGLLPVALL